MGTGRALTAQLGNPGYLGRGHGKKEGLTRRAGHRLLNSAQPPGFWWCRRPLEASDQLCGRYFELCSGLVGGKEITFQREPCLRGALLRRSTDI